MVKKLLIQKKALLSLVLVMLSVFGWAQVSITNTTAITDPLTSFLGTSVTTPANWTFSGNTTYSGSNQTAGTTGGWYGNGNISFLGSGTASNGNATWLLQNNTGATITGFTLSFAAKMWKSGTASPNVTVSYSNSATITNPAAGALANPLSSLTFNDATANISTGTTLSQTVTGLSIANGQYIFVRFIHPGGSSSDNLGWDDVTFTAATTATFTSTATGGDWNVGSTWVGGTVPSAGSTVNIVGPVNINNSTGQISNTGIININSSGVLKCGYAAGGASLTGTGTVNVTGTGILSVEQGGWPGTTNTYNYGTTGTLQFNNTSGSYGVNSTDTWFPATIPNVNVLGAGGITLNSAHTITTLLQSSAAITNPGNITIGTSGTLQLNSGYNWSGTGNPTYGSTSLLKYNSGGSPTRAAEWSSATSGAGYPANVQVSNNTILGMSTSFAQCSANLTIDSGSTLNTTSGGLTVIGNVLSNGTISLGGDVTTQGNWTIGATGTQANNNKAVFFTAATGNQVIAKTGGGTVYFDYLVINKAAGNVQLSSSPATSVVINSTAGDVLQLLNAGALDLNGQSLTLNNTNGNISTNGTARSITSSVAGATLNIAGNKFVTGTGTLSIGANVTTVLTAGLDFGNNKTTINGTLQINAGGYAANNSPIYGSSSLLKYNTGNTFGRGLEWNQASGTIGTTAGYPNNVQLSNNTTLNFPNGSNSTFKADGSLTIDSGSTIYLNYSGTNADMAIGKNIVNSGTLSLGTGGGAQGSNSGDVFLGGNWTSSGTFAPNSRYVVFNGASAQSINSATTFDYLTLNNSSGLSLAATPVTVNKTLTLTLGKITLGANNLTIGSTGSISGASATNYIVTNSTGQLKQSVGVAAVTFPVGSATAYNPITLANSGTLDILGIVLTAGTVPNVADASSTVNDAWKVSEATAGGSILTVVPQWNTADQGLSFATGTQAYVGLYDGTSWTQNAAAVSGTNPYTATGAASFSPSALDGTQYFAVAKDSGFLCTASNIPYTENFNAVTTPSLPSCTSVVNAGTGNNWATAAIATNGFNSKVLRYQWHSSNAANAWFFTKGLNLTAGTSYTLTFKYNNNSTSFVEKMKVAFGASNTAAGMTTQLADYSNITGGSATANTGSIDFVPTTTGVYYIGFNAYSAANQYELYVDDITVTVSPSKLFVKDSSGNNISSLSPFTSTFNTPSAEQSIYVSGTNLTSAPGNITVTAPADFQIFNSVTATWGTSLSLPYSTATLSSNEVKVRYNPSAACSSSTSNITLSGGGASTPPTVAVSGSNTIGAPTAGVVTVIDDTSFTANWNAIAGATGYALDVSTSPTFGTSVPVTVTEGFDNGTTAPSGWIFTGITSTYTSAGNFGVSSPSLSLDTTTDKITTPTFSGPISEVKFWLKGQGTGTNSSNDFIVEYSTDGGGNWQTLQSFKDPNLIPTTGTTIKYNATTTPAIPSNANRIRFQYNLKATGNVALDDVNITYMGTTPSFVPGYNNLAVTGTSYNVTGLDPNTTYYYRVRATTSTCVSANSNTQSVTTHLGSVIWSGTAWSNTTGPTKNYKATIAGNYDSTHNTGSFNSYDLTVNSGVDMHVLNGMTVKVENGITNNGNFVVESGGNLIQTNESGSINTGSINVRREISIKDNAQYNYVSSPVVGGNLKTNIYRKDDGTFVSSPAALYYIETTNKFGNSNGTNIQGRALAIKEPAAPITGTINMQFTGVPFNGGLTYTLANNNSVTVTTLGYNLIGNPYPSNIDLQKFYNLNTNETKINSTFWLWDSSVNTVTSQGGSGYGGQAYATVNVAAGGGTGVAPTAAGGSAKTPNQFVPVAQGFMVRALANNVVVDFDNTIRTSNSPNATFFGKGAASDVDRYWVNITAPSNLTNQMAVVYFENGNNAFSVDDSELKGAISDAVYSIVEDKKAVINGRSSFVTSDVIPLGTNQFADGNYTISLGNKEGVFANGQNIYLKDKQTGIVTNLSEGSYSFAANAGENTGRFEIVYEPQSILATGSTTKEELVVYKDGSDFVVKAQSKKITQVEVYDAAGRLIYSLTPGTTKVNIDSAKLNNGMYILKISQNGTVTSRKIIK